MEDPTRTKLKSHHREIARKVAQHEMAHYILARAMGFMTSNVSLKITWNSGHFGASTIHLAQPLANLEAVTSFLERRIIVLYAGAMGESLTAPHIPERGVDNSMAVRIIRGAMGAEQDHAKAREAIALLRNIRNPASASEEEVQIQLDKIDQLLWSRTKELVESLESIITGVAGALVERIEYLEKPYNFDADFFETIPAMKDIPLLEP